MVLTDANSEREKGRDISHSLVDGLARVGRVERVNQLCIGFQGIVDDVGVQPTSGLQVTLLFMPSLSFPHRASHCISPFDSHGNTDSPVSFAPSPDFAIHSVIQFPYCSPLSLAPFFLCALPRVSGRNGRFRCRVSQLRVFRFWALLGVGFTSPPVSCQRTCFPPEAIPVEDEPSNMPKSGRPLGNS